MSILKDKREKMGLTQVKIAKESKITERGYQDYEYGKREPKVRTAIRIAKVLNSTVEELFPVSSAVTGDIEINRG